MPHSSATDETMNSLPRLMTAIKWTRLISVLAVLSSLVGALVMFGIGAVNTIRTILIVLGMDEAFAERTAMDPTDLAPIELLECLDNFLIGLVFLYFAYGIYSLFIRLGERDPGTPTWLEVSSISSLKKTLLEVLVVLLAVVFVKGLLERLSFRGLEWTYLVIPLSILAIAASTRLMQFEKEPESSAPEPASPLSSQKDNLDHE